MEKLIKKYGYASKAMDNFILEQFENGNIISLPNGEKMEENYSYLMENNVAIDVMQLGCDESLLVKCMLTNIYEANYQEYKKLLDYELNDCTRWLVNWEQE